MVLFEQRPAQTRALNDLLRTTFFAKHGLVVITSGVDALSIAVKQRIIERVKTFDAFTPDNDPHGEHDFGTIEEAGHAIYFKIDYYDRTMSFGSDEPWNPQKTLRVMTLLLSEEY